MTLADRWQIEGVLGLRTACIVIVMVIAMADQSEAGDYRGGSYGELIKLPASRTLTVVCIPCLQLTAAAQEKQLGRELTRKEFEDFQAQHPAIQMEREDAAEFYKMRGCADPRDFAAFAASKQK